MAPFMFPSASAMLSAVWSSKAASSSAWRSADANTLRARCSAYLPPALAPSPAIAAVRAFLPDDEIGSPSPAAESCRFFASCTASTPAVAAATTPSTLAIVLALGMAAEATDGLADRSIPVRCPAMDSADLDSINLALLALRGGVGAVMLAHGINHIFGGGKIAGTARWFASLGMKPGILHAWLASITEVVGGRAARRSGSSRRSPARR